MLYHKDVDGDREYVHIFDEDKLKICFEALADTTNEIHDLPAQDGIKQKILGCVNPAQENRLTIPGIPPVVVLKKHWICSFSSMRHDVNVLNTYVSICGSVPAYFTALRLMFCFPAKSVSISKFIQKLRIPHHFLSDLLYRKMTFAEYTYLCNRKNCLVTFYFLRMAWQYSPDDPHRG